MKTNQRHFVVSRLRENKKISRNECLRAYVSRLSAIIQRLEGEGFMFKAHKEGGDYVYDLIFDPRDNPYYP